MMFLVDPLEFALASDCLSKGCPVKCKFCTTLCYHEFTDFDPSC